MIRILFIGILFLNITCSPQKKAINLESAWKKKGFTKKQRLDEFLKWKISDKLISVEAVFLATRIWEKLPPTKSDSFFLVDFSKPSTEKRLFLLSMDSKKVIWSDFVAHGKGSGELYAKNFSNENESHCTSIGLFQTAEHYNGKYGISVRLDGLEPGFNDFARERAIVIHAADYVSINFLRKHKRIGRSWGCPAVSKTCMLQIIHATNSPKYWLHYAPNSEWILDSKLF